jgi:zinc transport system ATP-binding protein
LDKYNQERALDLLNFMGIMEMKDEYASNLSYGQQKLLELAVGLMPSPKILLLDEPTASLDLQAEKELYELLRKLNERLTVVMVSHDLFFVSRFVNKVICVKGSVRVHPTSEISDELVGELYGRELRAVRHSSHDREGLEP